MSNQDIRQIGTIAPETAVSAQVDDARIVTPVMSPEQFEAMESDIVGRANAIVKMINEAMAAGFVVGRSSRFPIADESLPASERSTDMIDLKIMVIPCPKRSMDSLVVSEISHRVEASGWDGLMITYYNADVLAYEHSGFVKIKGIGNIFADRSPPPTGFMKVTLFKRRT